MVRLLGAVVHEPDPGRVLRVFDLVDETADPLGNTQANGETEILEIRAKLRGPAGEEPVEGTGSDVKSIIGTSAARGMA